jgi:hypothetical protein
MAVYLLGSPTENGNDLFLESQEVYDNAGNGVAVYASVENPSPHLLEFLGSSTPVAHSSYDCSETTFVDEAIRQEIENLLP